MRSYRRIIANTFVLLFGLAVALVGLEVLFRIYLDRFADETIQLLYTGSREDFLERTSVVGQPYIGFGLTPTFPSQNAQGYRGNLIEQKGAGEYRIVAIGASTTYGFGLETAEEAYPAQLEIALHNARKTHVTVVNAGVPSYTTWESTANLAFRVVDLQPDLIIIYHAGNDVRVRLTAPEYYDGLNAAQGTWQHPKMPLPPSALFRLVALNNNWLENPLWYETYLQSAYEIPVCRVDNDGNCPDMGMSALDVLEQNPPIYFERNLKTMIATARIHGSDVMLSTWSYDVATSPEEGDSMRTAFRQHGVDEHNHIIKAVAVEHDTLFFDLAAIYPDDEELWFDGVHLTAEGTHLQAELYADYLLATVFAEE